MPLDGFTPWPEDTAPAYRRAGHWQGRPLPGLLHDWAREHGTRTALVHGTARLTYFQLDRRVSRTAAGLRMRGIEPGKRVVVQLPNTAEFVVVLFALMRAGAVPVLSPTSHREAETAHLVAATEAVGYIGPTVHRGFDHAAAAARIAARSTSLRRILTLAPPGERAGGFSMLPGGTLSFPLHTLDEAPLADRALDASDVAFLLASGDTAAPDPGAPPRLVPRTHDDYACQLRAAAGALPLTPEDVYLAALPADSPVTLGGPGILGTLAAGGTVVLLDDPAPDTAFEAIEREQVTVTSLTPGLAARWLDALPGTPADLGSLRTVQLVGSAPAPDLAARLEPALGCRVQQVYGLAEGALLADGRPVCPADEIRVDAGELLVRGPHTARGYYRSPGPDAHAFTPDGFLRTGVRAG
ncbi:AMP-binding protein [Streptomyces sp. NPDC001606]